MVCKGICTRVSESKPFKLPYLTHAYCTRCAVWMPYESLKNNRCSCCNHRPRTKHRRYRGISECL